MLATQKRNCNPDLLPSNNILSVELVVKNVMEECDAPTQVPLGSEDPDYCVLSAMGAWLEIHFYPQPNDDNPFFFGFQGYNNTNSIKSNYSDAVRCMVLSETFQPRTGCHILGTIKNMLLQKLYHACV